MKRTALILCSHNTVGEEEKGEQEKGEQEKGNRRRGNRRRGKGGNCSDRFTTVPEEGVKEIFLI